MCCDNCDGYIAACDSLDMDNQALQDRVAKLEVALNAAVCEATEKEQKSGMASCRKKIRFQLALISSHVKDKESLRGEIKRLREENKTLWAYFHIASECVFVEVPASDHEADYMKAEEAVMALGEVEK